MRGLVAYGALLAIGLCACRPQSAGAGDRPERAVLAARLERLDSALRDAAPRRDTTRRDEPIARWILPASLSEISGLALTLDGRLLAHDDERGTVWEIDYRRGVVTKQFRLGGGQVHADFEGIAVGPGKVFLLTGNGRLYETAEGRDRDRVTYTVREFGLGKVCEFEGVAYDPTQEALLLACKTPKLKALKHSLVLFRLRWTAAGTNALGRVLIPMDAVTRGSELKEFRPSDITIDPSTGHYVLISSLDKALVELTPEGNVVRLRALPKGHDQPEGVAVTRDGLLIVADEANRRPAVITVYRWN